MKNVRYFALALLVVAAVGAFAEVNAGPIMNGAVIQTRIFNDCPVSTLNWSNLYPGQIQFDETGMICFGFANLHNWTLSSDGGITGAALNNIDSFGIGASLTLVSNNPNGGEAGIRISPWWAQDTEGRFNVRIPDGEIACFGGVLPFYSFTASHGLHYVAGTTVRLEMIYRPYANTAANPGTIEYRLLMGGVWYNSGELPFNNCTPGEEIHGCYGIMDDARVGGYAQHRLGDGQDVGITTTFNDICFTNISPPVAAQPTTMGRVKALYR